MGYMKPPLGTQLRKGHPLAKGLVGYWLMNEGDGNIIKDLSLNGHTLTSNLGGLWQPGPYGPVTKTDHVGAGIRRYFTTPDPKWNLPDFTIICHVNIKVCNDDVHYITSISGDYNLTLQTRGGYARGMQISWGNGASSVYEYTTALGAFTGWKTLAIVKQSTLISYYVDGILIDTDACTDIAAVTATTANIGYLDSQNEELLIDYLFVYNRAFSASEIAESYRNPFGMFEKEPWDLWTAATSVGGAPPAGTNTQINIGDAWKEIAAAQINIGDTWKAAAGMQINIGDIWKTIF